MHVLSSPNLPDVDTQLDNISLSYIYNIIQELVELTMFTFKYNFMKQIISVINILITILYIFCYPPKGPTI
jgi:hypothetical protein